jgi:DNA-binding beta-propeller fold protein YncE
LALTPDSQLLYVASSYANGVSSGPTVDVVDTATNRVIRRIDVGGGASDVAVSPNGRYAYVAGGNPPGVQIVSTSSQKVVGNLSTPNGADQVEVSPSGRTLYAMTGAVYGPVQVQSDGTGTKTYQFRPKSYLYTIDIASGRIITTANQVGVVPFGLAIDPQGSYVYETFAGGPGLGDIAVDVVSTSTHAVVKTIRFSSGANGIAVSPNGRLAYVCNPGAGALSVINTSADAVIGTIKLPAVPDFSPWVVAVSPNGEQAYVANSRVQPPPSTGTVSVIDLAHKV